MVFVSLLLNMAVLIPVSLALLMDAPWTKDAFGQLTPARGILLAIYLAIFVGSAALLIALLVAPSARLVSIAIGLFLIQIIYKLTTPLTVGTLRNPVVISNIAIAMVHLVTLVVIWPQG